MSKPLRCRFGLHEWSREKFHWNVSSNVKDYEKHCKLCGKTKKWVKTMQESNE